MADFSLDPEMRVTVRISFVAKGNNVPLTGADYKVKLFDKDLVGADNLGEGTLDENGVCRISFAHAAFGEWNNLEEQPDLYFHLYKGEEIIFESKVMEDIDLEAIEQFRQGEGEIIDLGTYLVNG